MGYEFIMINPPTILTFYHICTRSLTQFYTVSTLVKQSQEKLKKDMDEFINNVKYTVTEPEELSNGTWLITFASNETDNAKRRYHTYEDAKTVYDRLMLGMKDPDIDKDDFWKRMFYTDRY